MDATLGILDYSFIVLMLAVSVAVGLYFRFTGGRQKTTDEYFVGGKNMAVLPVAFSLMATYMSTVSVLGLPSEIYLYGTQFMLSILGFPIGMLIVSCVYLPVMFSMQSASIYEYLEKRFGKITKIVISGLYIFYIIMYMAVVLYAPALAFNAVTGLSTWGSISVLACVCIFYCSLGGLKAVLWTDVIQAILMFLTVMSVMIKGTMNVGGLTRSIEIARIGKRLQFWNFSFNLEERYTFWNCGTIGIYFMLSTFGTSQVHVQRLFSTRSLKRARIALFFGLLMIMIVHFFSLWNGAVMYSMFHDCDPILNPVHNLTLTSVDQLIPYTVLTLFSHLPGVPGLCIAGTFSASLSTVSSAINGLSTVIIEDYIRPSSFGRKIAVSRIMLLAKLIAIVIGGLCILMIFFIERYHGIAQATATITTVLTGPILGVFTLGVLTLTANEPGALIGLFSGLAFTSWMTIGAFISEVRSPQLPRSIAGCSLDGVMLTINQTLSMDLIEEQERIKFSIIDRNKNIFFLYKISFVWYGVISTFVTMLVGYICSCIIGHINGRKHVRPELISPMMRKWFFHSKDVTNSRIGYMVPEANATTNIEADSTSFL